MYLLPYTAVSVQIFTAILSLFYLKKITPFFYVFCFTLSLTAIIEVLGQYFILTNRSSHGLYYSYTFCFFNLITTYYTLTMGKKSKLKLIISAIIFNSTFLSVFFLNKSYFIIVIVGSLNVSFYAFLYLQQLLISDEIINYKKLFLFWLSLGLLVFYLPAIPFFSFIGHMQNRKLTFLLNILTILMNVFIIYGILICKKEKKY